MNKTITGLLKSQLGPSKPHWRRLIIRNKFVCGGKSLYSSTTILRYMFHVEVHHSTRCEDKLSTKINKNRWLSWSNFEQILVCALLKSDYYHRKTRTSRSSSWNSRTVVLVPKWLGLIKFPHIEAVAYTLFWYVVNCHAVLHEQLQRQWSVQYNTIKHP